MEESLLCLKEPMDRATQANLEDIIVTMHALPIRYTKCMGKLLGEMSIQRDYYMSHM